MARNGKLIDTWYWKKEGVESIKIEVRMVPGGAYGVSATFQATVAGQPDVCPMNSDIAKLRAEVFKILDERMDVTWERYFHVEFSNSNTLFRFLDGKTPTVQTWEEHVKDNNVDSTYDHEDAFLQTDRLQLSAGLTLEVEEVLLGLYPNGSKCWKEAESSYRRPGWPNEKSKTGLGDNPYVLIPATKENRQALHKLASAMGQLGLALDELLSKEKIQTTIQSLLKGPGLPALLDLRPTPPVKKGKKHVQDSA